MKLQEAIDSALRVFEQKEKQYPVDSARLITELKNIETPSQAQLQNMAQVYRDHHLAPYQTAPNIAPESLVRLANKAGLSRFNRHLCAPLGYSKIEHVDSQSDKRSGYIPYTRRPLNWHTDGYYLPASEKTEGGEKALPQIRSLLLHCARPGLGGLNHFVDHDIIFGLLCHKNRSAALALFDAASMQTPQTIDGEYRREAVTVPIFSFLDFHATGGGAESGDTGDDTGGAESDTDSGTDGGTGGDTDDDVKGAEGGAESGGTKGAGGAESDTGGAESDTDGGTDGGTGGDTDGDVKGAEGGDKNRRPLSMRYTQRKKNIVFKDEVKEGLSLIAQILEEERWQIHIAPRSGQGLIAANMPHKREAFEGDRLIYRIRSYDPAFSSGSSPQKSRNIR